jgi:phosphoenolpyruvate synthase/pyruvate phosphate dikinase
MLHSPDITISHEEFFQTKVLEEAALDPGKIYSDDIYEQSIAVEPVYDHEIEYIDTKLDGTPVPPILRILTDQAYVDTMHAIEVEGGLRGLFAIMEDRIKSRDENPTIRDWYSAGEEAQGQWNNGRYDKKVFHGQVAVAIRRAIHEVADETSEPHKKVAQSSPDLAERISDLDRSTEQFNTIPLNPKSDLVDYVEHKWPSATEAEMKATDWHLAG